jgi:hypothetical protein
MPDLRFASWAQTPIGAASLVVDDGAGGPLAPFGFRPSVTLSDGATVKGPELKMIGPGAVTGFDPRLVVRVDPPAGCSDAEDNFLASVELASRELPWALTPARAGPSGRLRPWIVLIVVEAGTPLLAGRALPAIEVETAELPDLIDAWGWAHVQLPSPDASPPAGLESLGGQQISRLVCPRRLAENRRYRACIVPAFEGGRLAGLGKTGAATQSSAPAWDVNRAGRVELPVYYSWEFATGESGDFEALVRRLRPADPGVGPGFGARKVDMAQPWEDEEPVAASEQILHVQGALRPFGDPPAGAVDDAAWQQYQTRIEAALAAPADRRAATESPSGETGAISPPIYGGRHIQKERVDHFHETPPVEWPWADWLNLHPANRIAAGLGAEYVRDNQEPLMASAWEQVGPIREANRLRAMAELSGEVAGSAHRRHVATMTPGELVSFAAPAAGRVRTEAGGPTMAMEVGVSPLPDAAASTAFARFTRPAGPVARGDRALRDRVVAGGLRGTVNVPDPPELLKRLTAPASMPAEAGSATLAAGAALTASTASAVAKQVVLLEAIGSVAALNGLSGVSLFLEERLPGVAVAAGMEREEFRLAELTTLRATFSADLASTVPAVDAVVAGLPSAAAPDGRTVDRFGLQIESADLRDRLVGALHPGDRAGLRLASRLQMGGDLAPSGMVDEVMASPEFPVPAALALLDGEPEWFLPGIGAFPNNRAMLLDINGEFIESYLVGLNHELMGELRWREYPTDLRGTAFRRFWPRPGGPDDIPPIHTWDFGSGGLGRHLTLGDDSTAALLIRGDVVRRFPDLMVSAVRAIPGVMPPQPVAEPGPDDRRDALVRDPCRRVHDGVRVRHRRGGARVAGDRHGPGLVPGHPGALPAHPLRLRPPRR